MKSLLENWRRYLKEEKIPLNIVYFGGFKPPHKGHFAVVQEYLSMPEVEHVYILFGNKPRQSTNGSVILSGDDSKNIWDLFIPAMSDPSKVTVLDPVSKNTMIAAAELAWLPKLSGKRISAGFGAKEPKYGKSFVGIVNSLSKKMGPPMATPVAVPTVANVPSVSATKVRDALSQKDVSYLQDVVPDGVSVEDYINILT